MNADMIVMTEGLGEEIKTEATVLPAAETGALLGRAVQSAGLRLSNGIESVKSFSMELPADKSNDCTSNLHSCSTLCKIVLVILFP